MPEIKHSVRLGQEAATAQNVGRSGASARSTLRILTVVTDFGIGGTQRVAQSTTLALQARGHNVAVLAHQGAGPRRIFYQRSGVQIFAISDYDSAADMVEAASAWGPDIVHIHRSGYPNSVESDMLVRLKQPGRKIVETNVFARYDGTGGGQLIDAHCLLSEWCRYKWTRWAGRAACHKPNFIVPNPVESDSFQPLTPNERSRVRAALGVPPERFLFGRVGQPSEPKWSPVIFEAFQRALAENRDIGLLLVGAPTSYTAVVNALPEPVQARIVMRPTTSNDVELNELFGAMDGFLHASRIGESFGMVLCEAMQAGVPIVTLSTPLKDNSQLEVVGHGRGGLIALDKRSLAPTMIRLMDDHALRQSVRANGARWVGERFSPVLVGERLEYVFRSVLANDRDVDRKSSNPLELLTRGEGRGLTVMQWLVFQLVHVPLVYDTYQKLLRALKRS